MISYVFGYGYGLQTRRASRRAARPLDAILSASGAPIEAANGFPLSF